MEKSDWEPLVAAAKNNTLEARIWRVVENQEEVATMALVDDLDEQAMLEEMLDVSKPPIVPGTEKLNYLLSTPFRYPPLMWGSRFSDRNKPTLFYASYTVETALAEKAYYQFVFWAGMETPPPTGRLRSQLTIFSTDVKCMPSIELQKPPFDTHAHILKDPENYKDCQKLGSVMRGQGIEGFSFPSARCPSSGLNVALFTPDAFVSKKPEESQAWLCSTVADIVTFKGKNHKSSYTKDVFEVDGALPSPA